MTTVVGIVMLGDFHQNLFLRTSNVGPITVRNSLFYPKCYLKKNYMNYNVGTGTIFGARAYLHTHILGSDTAMTVDDELDGF
jgi:hypothetical protein